MMDRNYLDLSRLQSFKERFEYLVLRGTVSQSTFGSARHNNQAFYRSREWRQVRDLVIIRDEACDLGVPGYEIRSELTVHHINPLTLDDILHSSDGLLDPNNLITTTQNTHNKIHYGAAGFEESRYVQRTSGDTKLW